MEKLTKEFLSAELKTKSPVEIAEQLGTYSNKIRRAAKKFGIPLNDKSEAQKLALKNGRIAHPTEGKERTVEEKRKIAAGVYNTYKEMTDDEKKAIKKSHQQTWEKMGKAKQKEMTEKGLKAVRASADTGSKTEIFLLNELTKRGYIVDFHRSGLIPNTKLEIDMHLPALKTIIEVNGKAHYMPIYGEEKLQKRRKADMDKYGLCLSAGYCVIVIKHITKTVSNEYHNRLLLKLIEVLENIKKKFPPVGERMIEVHE